MPILSRVVVLGPGSPEADPQAARERAGDGVAGLESLLHPPPVTAQVTGVGEACFFRASLALERGARTVIVWRGAFEERWLHDLAARAEALGGSLVVRDRGGRHSALRPGRRWEDLEVGAPDLSAWEGAGAEARGAPEREAVLGLADPPRPRMDAQPLELDAGVPGVPDRLEELAFDAGLKPVLYLVVGPEEASAARARFADAHAVELDGTLTVEPLTGARAPSRGAPVRHLFLARRRADAERAAGLWAEGSTRHVRALGALMGYPACCTSAFAALASRRNNAALTYVTAARTRALGAEFRPLLNHVVQRVVPFTPCSFGCARAAAWAERVLEMLPAEARQALRGALARPVLYFDEARALTFSGARVEGDAVTFAGAYWIASGSREREDARSRRARDVWGALLSGARRLRAGPEAFEIEGGERRLVRRGRPALGVLLPFGEDR